MLLQIIITHYKENIELPIRLLDSIAMQQLVNFNDIGIILVNDGNDAIIPKDEFDRKKYKFNITYYIKSWEGLSAARQYGFSKATADYILYCDCDDLFLRNDALYKIISALKTNADLITFGYIRDKIIDNKQSFYTFAPKEIAANCMVHGHLYKRSFLIKNNINWLVEQKTWHEDFYYNTLLLAYKPSIARINDILYWWKNTAGSVTDVSVTELQLNEISRITVCDRLISRFLAANLNYKSILLDALFAMYSTTKIAKENNKLTELLAVEKEFKANNINLLDTVSNLDLEAKFNKYSKSFIDTNQYTLDAFIKFVNIFKIKEIK